MVEPRFHLRIGCQSKGTPYRTRQPEFVAIIFDALSVRQAAELVGGLGWQTIWFNVEPASRSL